MSLRLFCVCSLFLLFSACSTQGGVYHTVKKGQTLYTISRTYHVDESYLARINGVSNPSRLRAGQQLYIPGVQKEKSVPVTVRNYPERVVAPAPRRPKSAASAKPAAASPPQRGRPRSPAAAKTPSQTPPPAARGRFAWPAKGRVVTRFGAKQHSLCQGIEIALAGGSAVHSAAAGKVIYSGDGITGYGNLVILRHDDSFFTVYGYNRKNLVQAGDFVSKGQKIALSGLPAKGGTPRLYFEIRYGRKPVDPIFYLP